MNPFDYYKRTHTEDHLPEALAFSFFLGLGIVLGFLYSL